MRCEGVTCEGVTCEGVTCEGVRVATYIPPESLVVLEIGALLSPVPLLLVTAIVTV